MTGDPRVLAGLQQDYLKAYPNNDTEADDSVFAIQHKWDMERHSRIQKFTETDAEIRAWTPPADAPDLAARVETLGANVEQQLLRIMESIVRHSDEIEDLKESLASMLMHPEPPAPDEPVCALCGRTRDKHSAVYAYCVVDSIKKDTFTPAPDDPVCATCGHGKSTHYTSPIKPNDGVCAEFRCVCEKFQLPAPAADLDPVRVEAAAKAAYAELYPADDWDRMWSVLRAARIETARRVIDAYLNGGAS